VDFTYSDEEQAFRKDVRAWLGEHLTDRFRALGTASSYAEEEFDLRREWECMLGEAGWIGLAWPKEYGGREVTLMQQIVFDEEYARSGAPARLSFFGEQLVGPTLMAFGSDSQKHRFLPPILRGEEYWCQGFSEPDAGSDLANLKTRAVLDGDEWVITGQKVWTSLAQFATWIFVLCRTDPEAPKHRGISYLLCPLEQPGIDVRRIRQITGTAEFNEVFFEGARTREDLVVGGVNNGWRVAMGTLGFERGTAFLAMQHRFAEEYWRLVDAARVNGKADDPVMRQRLARAYTGLQIMRYTGLRAITQVMRTGSPGVEASIAKLFWSQWHRDLGELAMDVLAPASILFDDGRISEPQYNFLFARSHTIYAGSSEIQRNIVGERVLGLPKEPKVEAK
jgi:alkylation response protein AidB-like acyl-CoA dehydrogenase